MTDNKSLRTAMIWFGIIALFLMFIVGIRAVLLPFVLGVLLAYFLDPLVDKLQRFKFSRAASTVVATVVFFTIALSVLAITLPMISEQLMHLLEVMPEYVQSLSEQYRAKLAAVLTQLPDDQEGAVMEALKNISGRLIEMFGGFVEALFASGAAVLNVISLLLITPVVTFYMLRDWDHIVARIDSLLPRAQADTIRGQLSEIDRTISGFVRGQVMVCSILALMYVVFLTAAGLNFSLVIGAATGVLIIIPYVGWFAGAVTGIIVAIMQYDSWTMVGVIAGIFLLGQVIESYFLTPKLVGDQVGLHPVWIIFGMLAGGALFGFVGVLIAVPVTAMIGVLTRFTIAHYLESDLYKGSKY
jgi:predicted PurR-regulated permease PerM